MIPAATVPGVPQDACTLFGPCWIAGTGFRRVVDAGQTCAVDDKPMNGKAIHIDPYAPIGTSALAAVIPAGSTGAPSYWPPLYLPPIGSGGTRKPVDPPIHVAPVPIEAGTAVLLLTGLGILALRRRFRR